MKIYAKCPECGREIIVGQEPLGEPCPSCLPPWLVFTDEELEEIRCLNRHAKASHAFYREVVLPGWARRGTLVDYDTAVIGPKITLEQIAGRTDYLEVICRHCPRKERLAVASLVETHGLGFALPDLLDAVTADCPKHHGTHTDLQCGAYYPDLQALGF